MVKLCIEYIQYLNFALVNNNVPLCKMVEITNTTDTDLHNIQIQCSGDFLMESNALFVYKLNAGETVRLPGLELKPKPETIASITEQTVSSFCVKVWKDADTDQKTEIHSEDFTMNIMPFDQWLGTSILPQNLASFVLPNHPSINGVIVKAAEILKNLSQSSAFTAYQSGNANEVRKQVAAVYGALHDCGIVYRPMPASFLEIGQRITMPDQVLETKLGNCLELTLLFASVLESIGINTIIVIEKEHAYLGVWLVDDCCQYSISDDASFIEKRCNDNIGEMMVLESTMVTSENTSFEGAVESARNEVMNFENFNMFIDVNRCRLEGFFPLPQRINENGVWRVKTDGVSHDSCELNVKEHSRYDLSRIMETTVKATKLDIWERKLLDFSLRNSLLNLSIRQRAIQFITFNIGLIEDSLQDGKEYVITHKPETNFAIDNEGMLVRSKLVPQLEPLVSNGIQHNTLHTYQTENETFNILKNIYRASRNAIEETGANALYLAIGTLRWYETDLSEKPRYAPILMLPVEMVYKKGSYYIRKRDEDIALNITLIEFLRQYSDTKIPDIYPLPTDEHGVDVPLIFSIIRDALKDKKRWDIEEETILGVFSFNKFLLWNDIHSHRQELLENDIVRSLVEQKLVFNPENIDSDLKDTDRQMHPDCLSLPVAVDSSQMAAVIAAGKGHSFILYGPPGTGKSQTITNIIANAIFQGKRVLFVAEKMAALSVVQNRLEKIGLGPFCLEMHSNKITKRHVLNQLKTALEVTHIVKPEEYQRTADKLYEQRSKLIEYMEALHDTKGDDGLSVYNCIVQYEANNAEPLSFNTSDGELNQKFSINSFDEYNRLLHDRLVAVTSIVNQPSKHPLLGLNISENQLADLNGLTAKMQEAIGIIRQGQENTALANTAQLKEEMLRDCNEGIFAQDGKALYQEWRAAKAKWFIPRFFAKRSFLKKLREFNALITEQETDALLNNLMEYQQKHGETEKIHGAIKSFFDYNCKTDVVPNNSVTSQFIARLNCWIDNIDKGRDWYQWCAYKQELQQAGLGVVARKIEEAEIDVDSLCDSFYKAMFKHLAETKIAQSPALRTFEGSVFDESVSYYQKLTEEFQMLSQKELYARIASQIPHVSSNIDSSSEIGLLNRNISNGGRGVSMRDLIDQLPTLMPRLCKCMLMSPMSVVQYIDLSQDKFDLVVFDEASQMPTSEAIGAIARGKSVIVVGDPRQMPPTSFFSSTNVNDDEADIDDLESILEDCRALEIPSLQLNWHYRSRHESLIAFSNNEYYNGSLITFPSVDDRKTKVKFQYVDGIYDKGGRRSNRKEAEAIVAEIARRLKQPDHASNSIGVIAFSVVQQNLIDDLLMDLLDKNADLRDAADEMYEPIFIKNLENVQGDERDIILFSIGYGPDKDGKVSMNFGPLNNAGGERRLNVAVSRARKEMMVFSALKSSHIDLRRSKALGVEGLKHFLEYAEQQVLVQASNGSQTSADSVIAEQIADALKAKGYAATTSIGRSEFKVDIAVSNEAGGDYSLGILLDGIGYHYTQTTRDREIVQPSVLRNLNWRIMRVWSIDWMNNPERVIERIIKSIKDKTPQAAEEPKAAVFDISDEKVEEVTTQETEYNEFDNGTSASKMSDKRLVSEIVSCEQPITLTYLCRRVCSFRDIQRVTQNVQNGVLDIVGSLGFYIQQKGSSTIIWKSREDAEAFSGYRKNNGRDITDIPIIEVMNAISETIAENLSIGADALTLITAKKLGFTRRGTKVDQALNEALDILTSENAIENIDGMFRIAEK
ncbi:MAG: DUF4011 domain-containing protein [Bacteroidaceae bacterium]|nr:DUF4011 domain-containing protein [Bacteroidaceae bacterium]